ncbi:alpha/beta fold hydrolase [Streptomyces mesophilus]|uniref:alpha/beta fold hydrolase n=1 Tax=Streptomyces mesophilus TaxID=1775132 RepID=UPI001F479555|nr:alpha/beta fold hydrolase [Streptomyces mesophilus]
MTAQRMINHGNVGLWSEEFGDTAHPPVLLVMGSMSQGVLWPDELVGRLAAAGRRVIRYDHRDTGRSGVVDFETGPYTWADIKDDLLAVLDGYGIDRAHIVGHSAGGLLAQWVAAEHPERLLTVIGSSPLGAGEGRALVRALTGQEPDEHDLPYPTAEAIEFFTRAAATRPVRTGGRRSISRSGSAGSRTGQACRSTRTSSAGWRSGCTTGPGSPVCRPVTSAPTPPIPAAESNAQDLWISLGLAREGRTFPNDPVMVIE